MSPPYSHTLFVCSRTTVHIWFDSLNTHGKDRSCPTVYEGQGNGRVKERYFMNNDIITAASIIIYRCIPSLMRMIKITTRVSPVQQPNFGAQHDESLATPTSSSSTFVQVIIDDFFYYSQLPFPAVSFCTKK